MFHMNYLQKNDLYSENSSSDNSVDIIDSESSEEIEEPAEESSEEPAEGSSEDPAEETSEETAEGSSEEPAEESSDVTSQVITVSVDSLSYNGITPPMYYESFSILVFLLAAILGVALFNIFRSKL